MKTICERLHTLFNSMKRYNFETIDDIPFNNGVYIFFENGEFYNDLDRIVRVGTDTGQNNLKSRMKQHFLNENKDRSIFRKNIGRAILNYEKKNELLRYWNLDLTEHIKKEKFFDEKLNSECKILEKRITEYLCENMSFVVFPFENKIDRLRFEEAIISALYLSEDFVSSNNWIGNYVPKISGNHVVDSRMWISQGIKAEPITEIEFNRLKEICEAT